MTQSFVDRLRPTYVTLASLTAPLMEAALGTTSDDGRPLKFYRQDNPELAKPGQDKELDHESTNIRIFLEQMTSALLIEALSRNSSKPVDISGEMLYLKGRLVHTMKAWDRCSEVGQLQSDAAYASLANNAELAMRQSLKALNIGQEIPVALY